MLELLAPILYCLILMCQLLINFCINDLLSFNKPFVDSVKLSEKDKEVLRTVEKLIVWLEERLERWFLSLI